MIKARLKHLGTKKEEIKEEEGKAEES